MKDVMLDLETLGTTPRSSIISIGAVYFGPDGMGDTFYAFINRASCRCAGLSEEAKTLEWWEEQTPAARVALMAADHTDAPSIWTVLKEFTEWLVPDARVWGNGASFDNAILGAAYSALDRQQPWKFYNDRCFRTLKNLRPEITYTRTGTPHNALDDAVTQAKRAVDILNAIGGWEIEAAVRSEA